MSTPSTTRPPTGARPPVSAVRAVHLIAGREVRTRLRTKAFLISNAVILVVIAAAIILVSVFTGGSDAQKVGLVGGASSLSSSVTAAAGALGTPVEVSDVADEQAARAAVSAGGLDVALVAGADGGVTAITEDDVGAGLRTVLDAAVAQRARDTALTAAGVDPAQLRAATAGAVVTVDAISPKPPVDGQRLALAYAAVALLYVQLLANGIAVATGVVEEKTSRVVELLLSTVKPLHLLVGKVLGIGLVGLVQLAAYGVVALTAALGTGLLTVTGTAVVVFVSTLAWFVLGFAFFAVLYAAAGAMVSRQEEIGSTTTPLTILVVAMFFVAQSTVQNPTGTISSVMSWIPPFSAILMPLRIAAGVASPLQVVGTVLLMVAVTSALAVGASAIYRRSILLSGARVGWRQALGRS
jgi:ABC-2 type transport system permease protein